ncbi:hypothetical protein ACROYT_G030912 [Oculina patagonica]
MASELRIAVVTCLLLFILMKDTKPVFADRCKRCKFDFEDHNEMDRWVATGTAFNNQPTYGDNSTARHRDQPSQHQGQYWIGGYENRPFPASPGGAIQGDRPQELLHPQSLK